MSDINDMRKCARCGGGAYGHPWADCKEFMDEVRWRQEQEVNAADLGGRLGHFTRVVR